MEKFSIKINEKIDIGVSINENVTKEDFVRILSKYGKYLNKNYSCNIDVEKAQKDFMDNYDNISNEGDKI